MTTISGILEGKTGNYFKLEDAGEEAFTILEDIDPGKTEIRSEKVAAKEGNADKRDVEYFHILVGLGTVQKDLSLTFTALKQLALVMPRTENWKFYMVKYNGAKGGGKNIKYQYTVVGKAAPGTQTQFQPQSNLNPVQGAEVQVLAEMKKADGWDTNTFSQIVMRATNGDMGAGFALTDKLKKEGRIFEYQPGMWKAV